MATEQVVDFIAVGEATAKAARERNAKEAYKHYYRKHTLSQQATAHEPPSDDQHEDSEQGDLRSARE
jgi:hypothetical protein